MFDTLLNICAYIIIIGLLLSLLYIAYLYFRVFLECIRYNFMRIFFRSKTQEEEDLGFGDMIMSFTISFPLFLGSVAMFYVLITEGITMEELLNALSKARRH
ncbi:hypothetical protein DC345_19795 [Paenibacillus taichungensis]|uniref:Uncharacterized protein n=1 Tax=Paenibacillus taichungensis TaxID=484184 RepID=A0A329QMK5_9BACL|nr:hypothetical protein [Paenibacillus taichungensis]RAW13587.1 hypothetical protein DC345_19795 [Paenibacillus taichungensis]